MVEHRRNIRCDVIFVFAQTDNHRAVLANCEQGVWIVGAQDAQCIRAADAVQHLDERADQIAVVQVVEQLCDNFGIGLRAEYHAVCLQFFLERDIILNDAVVHHGDAVAHARMRVRVDVVRCAVCCPAGVSDAERAGYAARSVYLFAQDSQTTLRLDGANLVREYSDACRVITAVLQFFQTFQQEGCRLLMAGIAYDSTHDSLPPRYKFFISAQCRTPLFTPSPVRF